MQLSSIFNQKFLFDIPTKVFPDFFIAYVIFFALLILSATAILTLLRGDDRKIYIKYVPPFFITGILGLIYLGGRYEGLAWVGTRFFFMMIAGLLLIWVVCILIWMLRNVPKIKHRKATEAKFKKYLPNAN